MDKKFLQKFAKAAFILEDRKDVTFSKIGGNPSVTNDFKWPKNKNNMEIPFFMQLDFSQINKNGELDYLPCKGLLYLFMDENEINTNYPLVQGEHYQFLYYNNDTDKLHIEHADVKTYKEIYLKSKKIEMYPYNEEDDELFDYIDKLSDFQQDIYFEKFHFIESKIGFVGGWPQILQSSYLEKDEIQLFQFNSDEDNSFMWGDLGMLQFYMKIDALKKANFNNVKANLETT